MANEKTHYNKIVDCYNFKLEPSEDGRTKVSISGRNSQGKQVRHTIYIEDYFLKYIHTDMIAVIRAKEKRLQDIKNVVENKI